MKFFTSLITVALASTIAIAAPVDNDATDAADANVGSIPENAILASYQLAPDESFLLGEQDDQRIIVLVNNTIAYPEGVQKRSDEGEDDATLNKRWSWITYRVGSPLVKREAADEGEAILHKRWSWITYRVGSPLVKRDADEGTSILNKRWSWITYRVGSPLV